MRLVLMEDLHIQPSEIDKLENRTKWLYYYYCMARRKIEAEINKIPIEKEGVYKPKRKISFPPDFVSDMENKISILNLKNKKLL